jgi:non-heme chloroperoxidase
VAKIDIPTWLVHGTKDRILPFENTAGRLQELNPNIHVVPVENGPHNIGWTFPEECNNALLGFLG